MPKDTIYEKKGRIRPPRVHITYETERNGAQVLMELPFVVGVLSDLSGQPKEPLPKLKDRKLVEIDRDNFDEILKGMKPRVAMKVDNTLKGDGSKLAVELNFNKLEDFEPENVAKQVDPLRQLLEVRGKLKDLLSRTEGNDRLEDLLASIISKAEVQDKLRNALGQGSESAGKEEK